MKSITNYLGLIGSILVLISVFFMPIVKVPFVGDVFLYKISPNNSLILGIFAIIGIVLNFFKNKRYLTFICGIIALIITIATPTIVESRLIELFQKNNPQTLYDKLLNTLMKNLVIDRIEFLWSLKVLFIGSILMILAYFSKNKKNKKDEKDTVIEAQ